MWVQNRNSLIIQFHSAFLCVYKGIKVDALKTQVCLMRKNTHFCHVLHSVPNFLESGLWVSPVVHTQGVGAPTKGHKINLRGNEKKKIKSATQVCKFRSFFGELLHILPDWSLTKPSEKFTREITQAVK